MNPKILYHLHHQEYTEDLTFWQHFSDHAQGAVLELGCGSGRVLLPLAQSGAEMWGIDIDDDLLAILDAEQVNLKLESSPKIIEGDFTTMDLGRQFSLIIMPCNTYSTLDAEARTRLVNILKQHLTPDGQVVIAMPNPELLGDLPDESPPEIESSITHPESGEPVQVSSAWVKKAGELQFFWHYDHIRADGMVERITASTTHHLSPWAEYRQLWLDAGFELETWGDFDFSPLDEDSPYIIFSAKLK